MASFCQLDITCPLLQYQPFPMGIRLFPWDISSPNSRPLCSLDNFFRHYNILTFQASPHVYCTPVTATVSYEPGLALNHIFTSFHCDELVITATSHRCSVSNRLISNRKRDHTIIRLQIDLFRIENSSHTLSPHEQTPLNDQTVEQASCVINTY